MKQWRHASRYVLLALCIGAGANTAWCATAAGDPNDPNDFVLSEPSGLSSSFSTDGLSEDVDEFNGVLYVSYGIPGFAPLRYSSRIDGVFQTPGDLLEVRNVAGFGLGWQLHFGRFVDFETASGAPRSPFAFEYPSGSRTRQICVGNPCRFTELQDGSRVEVLPPEFHDGLNEAVRVTTPDGVSYRLDYHVRARLVADAVLGVPNLWGLGPDGWYPTRVEDRYGNFTEIAYYGGTSDDFDYHTPMPRMVRHGRNTGSEDLVTRVAYFYLAGDTALDQEPADQTRLMTDARIGAIRFAGPNSTSATEVSPDWQTVELAYANHQLQEIRWQGSSRRFRFDYYAYNDSDPGHYYGRGRVQKTTYPSGGEAEYEYTDFQTLNASRLPGDGRYLHSDGVSKRLLSDRVTAAQQTWEYFRAVGIDGGAELALTYVWYHAEGDDGFLTQTWYEPMYNVSSPRSYKTGRMRHRMVYSPADAAQPTREERQYTAIFRHGSTRGTPVINYRAVPGAKAIMRFKEGAAEQVGSLELFRDPTRRGIAAAVRMGANGHKDYDLFGNAPYRESIGDITSVLFTYDVADKQDTVTYGGGSPATYRKDTYHYVVDTDPRSADYEAANLVYLVSRTESADRNGLLVAASETYYDDDARKPVEGIPGYVAQPEAILGRSSVDTQSWVKDGAEDRTRETMVSREYSLTSSEDQPKGALIREAVKVNSQGEFRRTRMAFTKGGSCVAPTSPTQTSLIRANNQEILLSRVEYNCVGAARWTEDENGTAARTTFVYDDLGRVLKEIQPGDSEAEPTTEYVYDDSGPLETTWRPRRSEIRKGNDEQDFNGIHTFYDGLGRAFHTQRLQSNGEGADSVIATSSTFFRSSTSVAEQTRPYLHADTTDPAVYAAPVLDGARGVTTRDGLGRVLSVQQNSGTTVHQVVHEYGDVTADLSLMQEAVTDEDGRRTITTYDSWGRTTRVELADANEVSYGYDLAGRLQQVTHPDKKVSTQQYDGLGRVVSKTNPGTGTETMDYDLTGAVTYTQLPHQVPSYTETTYDERGRIKGRTWTRPMPPLPALRIPVAEFSYDIHPAGSLIQNQGFAKGRLTHVKFSRGGSSTQGFDGYESYGYDAKGRTIEQIIDRRGFGGRRVETHYDRQGLVTGTLYQQGKLDELDLGFTYDENMRPRQVIDHNTSSACESGDRVLASYTYHADATVMREEWLPCPGSRLQGIDYERDEFGRLTRINDPSLAAALDPGQDANDVFGLKLGYEEIFQGSEPQSNGNVSWMQWRTMGNTQAAYIYAYDDRNQLESADFWEKDGGAWTNPANNKFDESFLYDELGNIKTLQRRDHQGALTNLTYAYEPGNGRRLTSLSGSITAAFRYDASGNMTFNGRWPAVDQMWYGDRNLLQEAYFGDRALTFVYDAAGARTTKQMLLYDSGNEEWVLGDAFYYLPLAIYRNQDLLYWQIPGLGRLVPQGSAFGKAGLAFYVKDQLGSIRATLHEDGTLLETTDYYSFGMEMPQRSQKLVTRELPQFTGQLRDREFPTTVDYFGARYYDPELGRFFGADALQEQYPSFSPYTYVLNNPIRLTDSTGNWIDQQMELEQEEEKRQAQREEAERRWREQQGRWTNGGTKKKSAGCSSGCSPDPAAAQTSAKPDGTSTAQPPGPVVLDGVTTYAPREIPEGTRWNGTDIESTRPGGVTAPNGELVVHWDSQEGEWEFSSVGWGFIYTFEEGGPYSASDIVEDNLSPRPEPTLGIKMPELTTEQHIVGLLFMLNFQFSNRYGYLAPGPAFNKPPGTHWKGPGWGPFSPFKPNP